MPQPHVLLALLLLLLLTSLPSISSQATTASTSTLSSAPTNPASIHSANDADRTVTLQARQSDASAQSSGGDLFTLDLFTSSPSCTTSAASPSCSVSCAPSLSPHTPSSACLSSSLATSHALASAHYATGAVTDNTDGTYTLTYFPEHAGVYDVNIQLATVGGLYGRYYDNVWFLGEPALNRSDAELNFQFGTGALTEFGVDYVSVRWEGKLRADHTETFTIYTYADDGVRVWIDRQLVIDAWETSSPPTETWATVELVQDFLHDIIVEYQELGGEATMELRWSSASVFKTIIPSANLYTLEHISGSPFSGITLLPGDPPSPVFSTASGDALTAGQAGIQQNFTITAQDLYGNAVDRDTVIGTWALALTGPDAAPTQTITYSHNDTYIASYTVSAVGTYSTAVTIDGSHLPNSPFTTVIGAGAVSATNSNLTGDGLTTATAGVTATFNVQLRDSLNNSVDTGDETLEVTLTKGATTVIGDVTYSAAGLYVVTYTATVTGSYSMTVGVNGVSVGTTYTVTVSPGAIHTPSCTASGTGLSSGTAAAAATFTVQAIDAFGNDITDDGETFVGTLTGAASPTVTFTDQNDGTYSASYTPTVAGEYSLAVTRGGVAIDSSPFSVTIAVGALDASASVASGDGISTATVGVETSYIIQTKDASGNNLDADPGATVVSTLSCGAVSGTATYTSAGQYSVTYTPTTAGSCTLTITLNAGAISNSGATVTVGVGSPTADDSTVAGDTTSGTAGSASSLTITAIDSGSNTHTAGGEDFEVTVVGAAAGGGDITGAIVDNLDGTYTVSYTPALAGTYTTNVQVVNVGGLSAVFYSDMTFTNQAATRTDTAINFAWGFAAPHAGVPADFFSAKWTGRIQVPVSQVFTFFAAISAQSGVRLYINSALIIDAWTLSSGSSQPFGSVALVAGTQYDLELHFRESTGAASLVLSWQSASTPKAVIPTSALYTVEHLTAAGSPFTTVIAPAATTATTTTVHSTAPASPSTDTSSLSSDIDSTGTAGTAITFTAIPRDALGNLAVATGDQASFTGTLTEIDSGSSAAIVFSDNGDGTYDGTVTPTIKGINQLAVAYSGSAVVDSPFSIVISPAAANAASCTASGVSASPTAGTAESFTITAKDANSNALTSGGLTFVAQLTGTATVPGVVVDNGDGTYTGSYTVTAAGAYSLAVTLGGVAIDSSPFAITASAAIADAALTAPTGAMPSTLVATFTVQAKDEFGNNHAAGGEAFFIEFDDKQNGFTRGLVTDNADGTYDVDWTLTAGSYVANYLLATSYEGSANGLLGNYYNNRWLQGDAVLTRVDTQINLDWGTGLVTPTASDYVSVSWTGYIMPDSAALYTFHVDGDDGARLYIDGVLVIDDWDSSAGRFTGTFTFPTADLLYSIRLDFRETTGTASCVLSWDSGVEAVVPSSALFPQAEHISGSPYSITVS